MTTTSADICNRALAGIAAQAQVVGTVPNLTGGGNASTYCNILYTQIVGTLLREQDWEFSKTQMSLTPSGNTPLFPFTHEHLYFSPDDLEVFRLDNSGFQIHRGLSRC